MYRYLPFLAIASFQPGGTPGSCRFGRLAARSLQLPPTPGIPSSASSSVPESLCAIPRVALNLIYEPQADHSKQRPYQLRTHKRQSVTLFFVVTPSSSVSEGKVLIAQDGARKAF